ncbi:hypothetical protein H4R24_004741 [Coemansia sp. RSA 988]|nr:hypothetical protein H4R24_004741 [Coemansia sp. RSA 988]
MGCLRQACLSIGHNPENDIDKFKTPSIYRECNSTDLSAAEESTGASASDESTDPSSSEQSTDSSSSEKKPVIMKTVTCHGLLYCMNEECFEPKVRRDPAIAFVADPHPNPRHQNRDTAASPADQSSKPTKRGKKSTKKPKTQLQIHSG